LIADTSGEHEGALSRSPTTHKEDSSMALKIRPLHDRILVKRLEEGETVRGGIIIPDTAKEKPQEGKVVAVGNGKVGEDGKKIPLDVKAGDKILFGKYSGSEVKIEDDEYLILREEDVLAILD
jgi:chaperonin GroES